MRCVGSGGGSNRREPQGVLIAFEGNIPESKIGNIMQESPQGEGHSNDTAPVIPSPEVITCPEERTDLID